MVQIFFANTRTKKFFESIEARMKSEVVTGLGYLSRYGYALRMPISKPLGGGLFELRIIERGHIRFIYTFHDGSVKILHGFVKKTNKIPQKELEYAKKQLHSLS